ncbi:DNA endonuclease RBBP8 isoform X2 [Halichoeres trimaculatus]|uniref:DNA endonuclease RBBP8 isoform X2 n=1 Tax=Halichoeres trimaculatus TaxID=147232 RepID=UPI003D9F2918
MSSPSLSSETSRSAELFEDLWRQLLETHQSALQELEAKVIKLKKERCLDAQKLEVFYNRNQQLKEQNRNLQDTVIQLEERLRSRECSQCDILKENLRSSEEENSRLIHKLKDERNDLEDKNRKLQAEVEKLKTSHSVQQHTSSSEQEEGFIPGSPLLPSSLPAANKLRKRRKMDKMSNVRYTETPLPQKNSLLFNEPRKEPGGAEVLVPNTCELDAPPTSNYVNQNTELEIAETCALDLPERPYMRSEKTAGQQSCSESSRKLNVHSKPDSTSERSPSLLPRVKRLSEDDAVSRAKRKKEDEELEDKQGKRTQPEGIKESTLPLNNKSFNTETKDTRVSARGETSSLQPNISCVSPDFKKPLALKDINKGDNRKKGNIREHPDISQQLQRVENAKKPHKVESTWSVDPALAFSMYDSECGGDEQEEECHEELVDTDCTWVSHSVLQRGGRAEGALGLGEKANDSLEMMFDTTTCGEYKSFNTQHMSQHSGQRQPSDVEDDEDEDEDEEDENIEEQDPDETTLSQIRGQKDSRPAFAHVAVIRKKEERRKLKGTTCKECEVYYAHLPEEERQKKLSSCSRHRFLYIPPCTPENFWEVGFPSTQTCIDRGYIREETSPQARTRRRQPYNALFSPKRKKQESDNSLSL